MTNDSYLGLEYLAWALFVAAFASVLDRLRRLPTRPHADMALFWGAIAWDTTASVALAALGVPAPEWLTKLDTLLAVALPYLLLRLVADFTDVPRALEHGVELGLAVLA